MIANGTTTVEIKTGYGLTPEHELRCLDVIGRLGAELPWNVEATYLGAHVVPDGRDRTEYVDEVDRHRADRRRARSPLGRRLLRRGDLHPRRDAAHPAGADGRGSRQPGCTPRRSRTPGPPTWPPSSAARALTTSSTSPPDGARAMAAAGVVGVLLPTVTLSLRTFAFGQYAVLRDADVTLALSTDCNPGTSWCESMPYVVQLACLVYGMPVRDALWAATRGGAAALRRTDVGRVDVGPPGRSGAARRRA